MIDWSIVTQLRNDIGAAAFEEAVALFPAEMEAALVALPGDAGAARAERLHFLKGAALTLGFADFAACCRAGEADPTCPDARPEALDRLYAASKAVFLSGIAERFTARTTRLRSGTATGSRPL